ncbi:hypothetical protein LTR53_008441 [Teratosphaeriaceae sp. CCFEE 6253]|nr:hypothetical protein LTR53_008441 [Teratosphaeriaceae sp. CCFEE 6253]
MTNQERMPARTAALLATEDNSNGLPGVIPKLAHLLEHDRNTEIAYLCDQSAVQVSKLHPTEGPFCGYRNLQMLCLSLVLALPPTSPAREQLQRKLTIPQLQDLIEAAWAQGHNDTAREQLGGGIRGTAKHIGTPEVEALLLSLGVPCTGSAFKGPRSCSEVLDAVEAYFSASNPAKTGVHVTSRLPIFLQRPGHSVTIVGIQRTKSGKRALIVFDPAWSPPALLKNDVLTCAGCSGWSAKWALRRYRKSERHLQRWSAFEMLRVDLAPRVACWR